MGFRMLIVKFELKVCQIPRGPTSPEAYGVLSAIQPE